MLKTTKAGNRKKADKTQGFVGEYYYKYLELGIKNVVTFYRNKIEFENQKDNEKDTLYLTHNSLTQMQLKEMVRIYDHIAHQGGLDEIKPNKGKKIKRLMQEKKQLLANFGDLACT